MKAIVTGGSGFIGSFLVEELLAQGMDVSILMRRTSSEVFLKGLKYQRVDGDLSNLGAFTNAAQEADYVFHLAGVTEAKDRAGYFEFNASGTRRVAQAVAESVRSLKRFVLVSSLAAGGPALGSSPRQESDLDRPVSAYGESKLQAEKELLEFKDRFPVVVVRPPWVYGPRDKNTLVLAKTIARGLMPMVRGATPDGHKYYSSIHVRDLCRGIVSAASSPVSKVPSGEVFYLAGDGVFTYEQFMTAIAKRLDRKPFAVRLPAGILKGITHGLAVLGKATGRTFPLNLDKLNEILPDYWVCSNFKAKAELGFVPQHEWQPGIAEAIDWYRSQGWIKA